MQCRILSVHEHSLNGVVRKGIMACGVTEVMNANMVEWKKLTNQRLIDGGKVSMMIMGVR